MVISSLDLFWLVLFLPVFFTGYPSK